MEIMGGHHQGSYCCSKKNKKKNTLLHISSLQKSSLKLNMVEGATSFGADLTGHLEENLRLSANWSSTDGGWCNGTTTQSIEVTEWLHQKKIHLLEWPSQSPDVNQPRCCFMTSREQFPPYIPKWLNWNSFVQRNGPKIHSSWPLCRSDLHLQKRLVEGIAAKGGSTSY